MSQQTEDLEIRVTEQIEKLISERKLKTISDTEEFVEGLLVGMEIAGLYGDEIKEIYSDNSSHSDSE